MKDVFARKTDEDAHVCLTVVPNFSGHHAFAGLGLMLDSATTVDFRMQNLETSRAVRAGSSRFP